MKLYFSIAIVVAALTGCGEKDEFKAASQVEKSIDFPDEFDQIWWTGTLPAGKTEPVPVDCIVDGPHGYRLEYHPGLGNDDDALHTFQYPYSKDCAFNTLRIVESISKAYREISIEKGRMELLTFRARYTVELENDRIAELLNNEQVCGHSDWKKGEYSEGAKELESCEPANAKGFFFKTPAMIQELKESIYQFKLLGKKGMEISRKKPGGDKFESPLYFVRLGQDISH